MLPGSTRVKRGEPDLVGWTGPKVEKRSVSYVNRTLQTCVAVLTYTIYKHASTTAVAFPAQTFAAKLATCIFTSVWR